MVLCGLNDRFLPMLVIECRDRKNNSYVFNRFQVIKTLLCLTALVGN